MGTQIVYRPEAIKAVLERPGKYPFTRGIHESGYIGKLFTMRQFAGCGDVFETNALFKTILANGGTGLSVAKDLPTVYGRDSDDSLSCGEVGKLGVAIDSLQDMEILFDGIPLDKITTSMTINAPANVLLAMYIATAQKQGIPPDKLGGTIQGDMLKEYIAQKEWIVPMRPAVKMLIDIVEYCTAHMPKWNTISISGYHIREAGSTAVQELAYTLADGICYVEESIKRGMQVDEFAPRLSFFFNVHNNFFEEIAKLRAARRMWAKIMKERFNAQNPRSWWCRIHAQTAGCTLTGQQPLNNLMRASFQALAAVLGGAQSIHVDSMDEELGLPSEEAAILSLRTLQIIAHETGITKIVDPLGGSYYLEHLTNQMEQEVSEIIEKIDSLGGMMRAIELGYPQKEIAASAYEDRRRKQINDKDDPDRIVVVGVNEYVMEEGAFGVPYPPWKPNPETERKQVERLKKLKAERDNSAVQNMLQALERDARDDKNLMPCILQAVKVYATLGEICNVLKKVYGEYHDEPVL